MHTPYLRKGDQTFVFVRVSIEERSWLKHICIEILDNFLLANMKDRQNRKESFLPFVDVCFRSKDVIFQSLGNLEKKCETKIEHFAPL